MRNLFHKRSRSRGVLTAFLGASVIIIGFQNCAPQKLSTSSSTSSAGASSGTASSSSSRSTSGTSSTGSSLWGSSSGSGSGSGTSSSSSIIGSGSSGGGVIIGSGSGGGGSGGGGLIIGGGGSSPGVGGGNGGASDRTFRIVTQPQGLSVLEGAGFELKVIIAGGKSPFTYQWYQNNQAIGEGVGTYSFYTDEATSYKKEGAYYVIVRDATGASLQSAVARVVIQEPSVGCNAGSYFTFTESQYDLSYGYFSEYLDPAPPRAKYLLHSSYDRWNFLYPNRKFTGLQDYNVPSNLEYLAKTWVSCRTSIPRIHTPTPNPSISSEYGYGQYDDNGYWTYEGKIEFECRNKKLKLLANTCAWVNHPEYGNSQ